MLTIRNNIFETNSSSTHSLIIECNMFKPEKDYTIPLEENGDLVLSNRDFSGYEIGVDCTYDKIILCMIVSMMFDIQNNTIDYVEKFKKFLLEKTAAKNIVNNIVFGKSLITSDILDHEIYQGKTGFFKAAFGDSWVASEHCDEEFYFEQIIKSPELLEQFIFGKTTLYTEYSRS